MSIIEGKGINGLQIDMTLEQLNMYASEMKVEVVQLEPEVGINPVFNLHPGLTVYILNSTNLIYKISFSENSGFNWRGIETPCKVISLKKQSRYLLIDDFDKNFHLKGIPGIVFEPLNKDFRISDFQEADINVITVYDPVLDEKNGYSIYETIDLETGEIEFG